MMTIMMTVMMMMMMMTVMMMNKKVVALMGLLENGVSLSQILYQITKEVYPVKLRMSLHVHECSLSKLHVKLK